ncbi:hypothetical protein GE061_003869 [Apolygus lucorum]|uniref:Uncharacterized protein n=1 Tax=Apolygus lucorum TaxID=248454 RepID=A0A8S9WZD5_APOLU|nr:hypothetical protein GE061_003869 [Apolygus lucorum]
MYTSSSARVEILQYVAELLLGAILSPVRLFPYRPNLVANEEEKYKCKIKPITAQNGLTPLKVTAENGFTPPTVTA